MRVNCIVSGCENSREFSEPVAPSVEYMCSGHDRKIQLRTAGRPVDDSDFLDGETHFQQYQFDPQIPRGSKPMDEEDDD